MDAAAAFIICVSVAGATRLFVAHNESLVDDLEIDGVQAYTPTHTHSTRDNLLSLDAVGILFSCFCLFSAQLYRFITRLPTVESVGAYCSWKQQY